MPKDRHTFFGQYTYDGVVFNKLGAPKKYLDKIKHKFQLREEDVIVAAYPKSGNTWMDEIVWLIMNDGNVEKAKNINKRERTPMLDADMGYIGGPSGVRILEKATSPRVIKTHLYYSFFEEQLKSKNTKIILGVRNIKDVLVSYYHFYRMNMGLGNFKGSFNDFFELFKEKELYAGDWFDFTLGYWEHRHDLNLFVLKYEDLHADFEGVLQRLARFLGKELTEEQMEAITEHVKFEKMKDNVQVNFKDLFIMDHDISPFMRKGVVGDWKNYFTEDLNVYMDQLYQEKMEGTGLELDFESI